MKKKLLVWGTGIKLHILERFVDFENVLAFIDNNASKKTYMNKPVIQPKDIIAREFDAIIVATIYSDEIADQCNKLEIPETKIIYFFNNIKMQDMNKDPVFVALILGEKAFDFLNQRCHLLYDGEIAREPTKYHHVNDDTSNDYARIREFELCVREIKRHSVLGNVAELGVFRGEFAQYINMAFPEKKLYLFDTFSGFNEKEAEEEITKGHTNLFLTESLKNTSIDIVMKKMSCPNNVVVKQGLFPDSLNGLEDSFAFVSIDVDFAESIYQGLKYFYQRLNRGGYIFVHDYNTTYLGVEEAVDRFEKENGPVAKVPLCDYGGTLVITK